MNKLVHARLTDQRQNQEADTPPSAAPEDAPAAIGTASLNRRRTRGNRRRKERHHVGEATRVSARMPSFLREVVKSVTIPERQIFFEV
jgi:hypothetical protein